MNARAIYVKIRDPLAIIGAVAVLFLLLVGIDDVLTPSAKRRAQIQVSPTASRFAGWISPELVKLASDAKPEIIENAGGPIERFATKLIYPYLQKQIPTATEVGCDRLLTRFGDLTARQMAESVIEHQRAHGHPVHWTVQAAIEQDQQRGQRGD